MIATVIFCVSFLVGVVFLIWADFADDAFGQGMGVGFGFPPVAAALVILARDLFGLVSS